MLAPAGVEASFETALILRAGQSAVIADVSEDSTSAIDTRMEKLGGKVYRRSRGGLHDDAWFREYPYYLYPYEYIPPAYARP